MLTVANPKKEIKSRTIRIKLLDGTKINGQVNINRDPEYDRLSDLVTNDREPFLVVFQAQVYEEGLDKPIRQSTIFVNKQHILWATPEDEQK